LSATQRQTNSAILYTLLIIYASVNFHAVRQLATVLVGHRKNFPVELLDDQRNDDILRVVFLRHDEKDGTFEERPAFGALSELCF